MFSLAGAVKVIYEGNQSLWTFMSSGSDGGADSSTEGKSLNIISSDRPSSAQVGGKSLPLSGGGSVSTNNGNVENDKLKASPVPVKTNGILKVSMGRDRVDSDAGDSRDTSVDTSGGKSSGPLRNSFDAVSATEGEQQHGPGSSNGKINKRRKKKETQRARANSSDNLLKKNVRWGSVDEIKFARDIAFDAIPSDGMFPIGLGVEVSRANVPIDESVAAKQADLLRRAMSMGMSLEQLSKSSPDGSTSTFSPLETRQFDYKTGKNPLFARMSEQER